MTAINRYDQMCVFYISVQYAPIPNRKSRKYFQLLAVFIWVEGIFLVNTPSNYIHDFLKLFMAPRV